MEYRETLREAIVEGGKVRGIYGNNPIYTVFKGIPYAAPPVGELRWKAPQPVIPWEGTKICYEYGAIAEQSVRFDEPLYGREFFQNTDPRGEDCLYLNVWTPAKSADEKLPVFFWVHGGGFFGGAGSEPEFDGEGFCKRGVIMVSINYRLGALGFMAHPLLSAENEKGISGNYGLLDQIAALKWTKNNIAAFGGDPENITIAGQSAGAGSILNLISSPLSRGLMKRAIIQSGARVGKDDRSLFDLNLAEAEKEGAAFMEKYGASTLEEMRAIPSAELVKVKGNDTMSRISFRPLADGIVLEDSAGLVIEAGDHADIDYIVGNMQDEGGNPRLHEKYAQILSPGNTAFAELQEKLGRKPVYTYCFSRDLPGDEIPLAFHAGELWYEFETLTRCWRPFTGVDYDLSVAMASYFANFIKTGNPNSPELPEWTAFTEENRKCLELCEDIKMIDIE